MQNVTRDTRNTICTYHNFKKGGVACVTYCDSVIFMVEVCVILCYL